MAELPSKSRPAARKRGGRARGQMAGGMLASLSASAKPKATTTSHAHHAMSSSLMHLNQDDNNSNNNNKVLEKTKKEKKAAIAVAAPRRIPLKEESMNSTMGRQEIPTKAVNNTLANKKTANAATEVEASTTTKQPAAAPLSTTVTMTTASPRNDNPEAMQQNVVKSPYSILSPLANDDDDDDTLTTPPLTSVKMKNQLHTCVLSPISLVGLSTPAKMEEDDNGDDEDTDDDDESFAESKEEDDDDDADDSLGHSNSSKSSSNESDESSNSSHTSSSISNEEIAANPRSVIQRKIAKDFYGKTYVGTITGYDDSEKPVFWQVEYTDGDGEDYSYGELMQGMAYFEEKFGKDGVNLPSNYSPEESSCDYEDDENNDDDECFDDDETDDDEDYSIEQDSDSEDELEIDEGVDSEKKQKRKNGKSRGKKGTTGKKVPANDDIKSDTMSGEKSSNSADQKSEEDLVVMLEACRVDLSTQLDDDEVEEDNMNVDFNVSDSESSPDHITADSDSVETEDSDPVAVEVLSEDGTSTGVNSEPTLKESTSVEMQAFQDTIVESTIEEAVIEAESFATSTSTSESEATFNKPGTVEAMVEPQGQPIVAVEAKIEVEADVAEGANDNPRQPTILELFAVVDQIFIESDTDTVTVKDVKNSVADHFGLEKVSKEIKKAIRDRLTDLIQGNVQPAGAMEETASENYEEEQEDAMTEAVGFSIDEETNTGDSSNIVCDESSSPVGSSGAISHSGSDSLDMSCFSHDGSLANDSQSNSVSTNDDQMALSGTLFQNLSPEFSIYSRSSVNDEHYKDEHDVVQMKSISSPYKANKPKSRSVVVKGKWSLGPEIGIGSFGRVHTGLNTLNGSLMAVKVLKIPSDNKRAIIEDLQREIDVMKTLNHPNLVRYLGAEVDNSHNILNIFQEWVPGGSISSLLKKFGPFSVDIVKTYVQQVLKGLDYLHSHGIIHRDIKGGNILVSNDGSIKLADFGASKKVEALGAHQDRMEMTMRGTPYFMAPEVFEENYGQKADIWSVGGVIYQMVTGVPPWKSLGFKNPISLFVHIKSHSSYPELPLLKSCDRHNLTLLQNILSRCFQRDPSDRPFSSELLGDAFFSTTVSKNATPPSPQLPLLSPSLRSPLHRIVEDQELATNVSEPSGLHYSLEEVSEEKATDASLSDSLCYSLTLTSPLKVNNTSKGGIDSSKWPEWAKKQLVENKATGKENPTMGPKSKAKGNVNPFATKKKPFSNHNGTYSSGAAI